MEKVIKHPEAEIRILNLPNGKRQVTINPQNHWINEKDRCFETAYPIDLIQKVLNVKGPFSLNDEIRREEDPLYTKACLECDILGYLPETAFKNKRILDFGCGAGASSMVLARMFPETEIVGIDLSEQLLSLARARAQYYQYNNMSFFCSPTSKTVPQNMGKFDFILFSAVFEHLLPEERAPLLEQIWSLLNPGGVLFINQTPYCYFPFEGHTTHLYFVNYLPDKMAHFYARKFSKRVRGGETWNHLLRQGIRGSCPREIGRILKNSDVCFQPSFLKPSRLGLHDRIDVWYAGYAVYIAYKYPKVKMIQLVLKYAAKLIYIVSGIVFLPTVSIAIKKIGRSD